METLFEIMTIFIVFFIVNYGAWWLTEVKGLPQWLQYKPWICRLCLTFWTLFMVYLTILLSFQCLIVGIGGIILAAMNAFAMWYHIKTHTVKI